MIERAGPWVPAMSNLLKGVSSLKVKEVPGFVSKYAGENLTKNKVEGRLTSWYHRYKKEVRRGALVVVQARPARQQHGQVVRPGPLRQAMPMSEAQL